MSLVMKHSEMRNLNMSYKTKCCNYLNLAKYDVPFNINLKQNLFLIQFKFNYIF